MNIYKIIEYCYHRLAILSQRRGTYMHACMHVPRPRKGKSPPPPPRSQYAFFPAVLKEHFLYSDIGGAEVVKGRSLLSELNFVRTIKELNAVFLLNFSQQNSFFWYEEVSNILNVSLPMPNMCVDDIFG